MSVAVKKIQDLATFKHSDSIRLRPPLRLNCAMTRTVNITSCVDLERREGAVVNRGGGVRTSPSPLENSNLLNSQNKFTDNWSRTSPGKQNYLSNPLNFFFGIRARTLSVTYYSLSIWSENSSNTFVMGLIKNKTGWRQENLYNNLDGS